MNRIRHKFVLSCYMALLFLVTASGKKRVHFVHWEKSNPMFRIDNTDNVIDVNVGNTRWEYDQANFVCPRAKTETEEKEAEKYIIYNVSKEEYDSCMVTQPSSRIVATCTGDSGRTSSASAAAALYFTITFRSFSPIPGSLEFHPGKDYYFITTSVPDNLESKFGGRCASHNMKVIFKVANATSPTRPASRPPKISSTTTPESPQVFFADKNKYYPVVTRRPPSSPQEQPPMPRRHQQDKSTLETAKKVLRDFQKYQNEVAVKQEASRMHTNVADSAAVATAAAAAAQAEPDVVLIEEASAMGSSMAEQGDWLLPS